MEMLEIHDLDEKIIVLAVRSELKSYHFFFSLEDRTPKDLSDLLSRVEKYIKVEEAMATQRKENSQLTKRMLINSNIRLHNIL